MPIQNGGVDASIPLQVKPVQPPDMLKKFQEVQSIRDNQQNLLLRQQEMQNSAQTNQFNALKMAEYQKQTGAENTEGDLVTRNTVTPQDANGNPTGPPVTNHNAVVAGLYAAKLPKQALAYQGQQATAAQKARAFQRHVTRGRFTCPSRRGSARQAQRPRGPRTHNRRSRQIQDTPRRGPASPVEQPSSLRPGGRCRCKFVS